MVWGKYHFAMQAFHLLQYERKLCQTNLWKRKKKAAVWGNLLKFSFSLLMIY